MKKALLSSVLGLGLGLASFSAMAFDDSVNLSVDGKPLVIQEMSGRVLGNAEGTKVILVDDIFAGQGKKAVPGYQVMFMGRTASVAVEAKKTADGKFVNDRMIHRGVKVAVAIPAVDGKMDLANAKALNVALISDENREFKDGEKFRPRGEQLVKKDAKISNVKLSVKQLDLPDVKETSGGGIVYTLSFEVNGRKVVSEGNSTFRDWNIAKTGSGEPTFKIDPRVLKAQK